MWILPIDLKLRLGLRVSALAALCFVAALAFTLFETHREARLQVDRIARTVASAVTLQQEQTRWIKGAVDVSSGLEAAAAVVMEPGLCISYRSPNGETREQLCSGSNPEQSGVPGVFAAVYSGIFDTDVQSVRPVSLAGAHLGDAVASITPQRLIGRSWDQTSHLAVVMATALLALCGFVYLALATALRPTRVIRTGLERLAAGDLSARLPPFDLAELSAVGHVFNQLAGSLEVTVAERSALTRQLIAVQDEERRRLARELHDEFGQCLAAIGAVAASAGQVAQVSCPVLVPDCGSIGRTAAHMMEALRNALLRLRPPDVGELGLVASLESLVSGWNSAGGGRTTFRIELDGVFDGLPEDFAANLYRIAQEAITNAAKHAEASSVVLRLRMQDADIELFVADNGKAGNGVAVKSGMGLLGMRERVAALGGSIRFDAPGPGGLQVRAVIPVPVGETRVAA
ncbi:sensor histidine kinase [Acidisphaera sp. S103]|uniref:sensor histidine kinase n=1 Tax=Acidisphaera sp. S103 TaxID=1747223 RepID=UPI00131CD728|nr:sensor histidine kinase [Acidisphaera sp. S103]